VHDWELVEAAILAQVVGARPPPCPVPHAPAVHNCGRRAGHAVPREATAAVSPASPRPCSTRAADARG
ncbi:MAG: hypothetical protein J0I62_00910, partial [Microbacterium sp.]|nr:hypothetical protein [Microbacterium sp.]